MGFEIRGDAKENRQDANHRWLGSAGLCCTLRSAFSCAETKRPFRLTLTRSHPHHHRNQRRGTIASSLISISPSPRSQLKAEVKTRPREGFYSYKERHKGPSLALMLMLPNSATFGFVSNSVGKITYQFKSIQISQLGIN